MSAVEALVAPDVETARVMVAEWKAAYEQVCAERDALHWRVLDCSEVELARLREFARAVEAMREPVISEMARRALEGREVTA